MLDGNSEFRIRNTGMRRQVAMDCGTSQLYRSKARVPTFPPYIFFILNSDF
jgi:hypothetical protein